MAKAISVTSSAEVLMEVIPSVTRDTWQVQITFRLNRPNGEIISTIYIPAISYEHAVRITDAITNQGEEL